MTLNFEYETDILLDVDYKDIVTRVVNQALDYEGCPYETELSIILTENEEISKMNCEFRGIDSATDVLSFPMIDYNIPSDFSDLEDNTEEYFNPETGELILGDIVISVEKVMEQAENYGHSIERELAFLTAHSVLHLCGYDHIEEDERVVMEKKQEDILESLSIRR